MAKGAVGLSLETIPRVRGGAVAVAVNQAISAAIVDCRDRPQLKKDRVVTLKIKVKPTDESDEFEDAVVEFDLSRSFPSKSLTTKMLDTENGLSFQPMISDNPNQQSLLSDLVDGDEE